VVRKRFPAEKRTIAIRAIDTGTGLAYVPFQTHCCQEGLMFAFKLIQLIETRSEHLSEGLMDRLKKNDRCIELLRRVPSDELRRRSHEIYCNLNDWLRNKTESEIEERYIGLGMRRAKQGVPYTDFFSAVSTTKEHLWEFMQSEGLFAEPIDLFGGMDLLHSLDRFFDRILYFAAVGYQNAHQVESEHTRRHAVAHR
jgi:hypothetical protein